jgi:hypothetical protein
VGTTHVHNHYHQHHYNVQAVDGASVLIAERDQALAAADKLLLSAEMLHITQIHPNILPSIGRSITTTTIALTGKEFKRNIARTERAASCVATNVRS